MSQTPRRFDPPKPVRFTPPVPDGTTIPGTLCAIVVDARPAGSGLFTIEAPFTASPEELLDRVSLYVGNVFEEAQRQEGVQCFFNDVQWALPLKRQLANGDVFCCRPVLEGSGLPLLGPGGNRHTLQRRREAPYFEVLRAVELGSQTLTLSFGDRMLEDVLAELVYRRHQLGPVPAGLCMQLCPVQPAPAQGRRELIVLLFCRNADGTFPVVCDRRDVGGHIWVAALDADVPFESGCVPFLDGLPCPASPQLYAGAMITLRPTHSSGQPNIMPVSAWWNVHPFSALISSPVSFPEVAPESFGFQNAAIREAFNALLDVRVARGFALFEGRVAIFGPGSSLVFASGQASPTAERLAQDLSVYLLRTFGPGQIAFTRLHLADCAIFAYRADSLRSELSLCLHSLGGGYVLRVVPAADLRTIQEPIFLFPGIDSPVARVSDPVTLEPERASADALGSNAAPATSGYRADVSSSSQAASSSPPPGPATGTSMAQTSFGRSMPRMPAPRNCLTVQGHQPTTLLELGPADAYAAFALDDPRGSASSSDESRRSSALSYMLTQEVPHFPMADVRIADARLVVGNGIPGPVPFTIFDVLRTVSADHYDPRSGVQDAVGRAIANAPFAPIAWHFPAIEVAPFPGPQIVLCRFLEQRTVIVDLRDCALGLHVLQIDHATDPAGLLTPVLQRQIGPRMRSHAVQVTLNGGVWTLGLTRWPLAT